MRGEVNAVYSRPMYTEAEAPAERVGLWALVVDVVLRPAAAMRRIAAHPDRRWLAPLVALALVSVAHTLVSLPARQAHEREASLATIRSMAVRNPDMFGGESPEEILEQTTGGPMVAFGTVLGVVGAIVGTFVAAAVVAAVLHFLGTILGGQQTYSQMLSATSWARVPLVFQGSLRLAYAFTGGYDPNPSGLEGLVAPASGSLAPSPLGPILAHLSIWNLWMLGLFVVAVHVVSHVSRRKALVAVGAYVLLTVLLGEVGVVVGGALLGFSQTMGGGG